ncbi:MAG: hypothetical protein ACK58L_07725 [Planctomycetota bacterium]
MNGFRVSMLLLLITLVQTNFPVAAQDAATSNLDIAEKKNQPATRVIFQQDIQSEAATLKPVKTDGTTEAVTEDPPKLLETGWRHTIVLVKADWRNAIASDKILNDIRSVCSAEEFEWLQSLDSDPLQLGPSLVFGRPGYVATFESAGDFAEQLAWLDHYGLMKGWIDTKSSEDSILSTIPTIQTIAKTRPHSSLLWKTRLIQDISNSDYVKNPFRRLVINRTLLFDDGSGDGTDDRWQFIDISNIEAGTEIAGVADTAFVVHFFPLQRDAGIRSELANMADTVAFLVVHPNESEFAEAMSHKPSERIARRRYHFEPGDFMASVSEQSIPTHGWDVTMGNKAANVAETSALLPEVLDARLKKIKVDLKDLELRIQAEEGQIRNPNVNQGNQTREVRSLIEQAFDLRQQMQELESQRLRLKLQELEKKLAVRAKSREAMVERRMEEFHHSESDSSVSPQEP